MTVYPLLAAVLVVAALLARVVLQALARRRGRPLPVLPSVIAGAVLVTLTLVFDNLMIAVGLVAYEPGQLSGIMIGVAPVEDLSYPIATAALLPAVWHLLGGDRDRA